MAADSEREQRQHRASLVESVGLVGFWSMHNGKYCLAFNAESQGCGFHVVGLGAGQEQGDFPTGP